MPFPVSQSLPRPIFILDFKQTFPRVEGWTGKSYGGAKRKPEDEGFGTESALTLSEIKYSVHVRTGAEEGKGGVEWRRCAITDRQVGSAMRPQSRHDTEDCVDTFLK